MVVPTSALLQDAMKRFTLRKAYQHRLEINGISLSDVPYAYCAFANIFKKRLVSMENSSLVSGGLISIVFMELGIQSSHLSTTTQQKIWYHVKKSLPGNVASSLAKAS